MSKENRLEFHNKLLELLPNVYFSPPESKKLEYPCAIYQISDVTPHRANNFVYAHMKRYRVLHIYKNPDKDLVSEFLEKFSYCRFSRHYTADNLNHDVFEIYYKN